MELSFLTYIICSFLSVTCVILQICKLRKSISQKPIEQIKPSLDGPLTKLSLAAPLLFKDDCCY